MKDDATPLAERFAKMVQGYARLVRSVVVRVGGAAAAQFGDDVEQRVFLEIWKQVSSEQEIMHPSSYIYRAAVRETVRLLRQERRHQGVREETETVAGDAASNPAHLAESQQLGATVREVIRSLLPARQKAVNAHLAGLGVREIMQLQGWTYSRARNLIARGMADLRRGLEERDIDV